jgi:hypothetical protein
MTALALTLLASLANVAAAADRARLDVPGENACIAIVWEDDDPTQSARRYGLRNTCDHAVSAHWCTGDECRLASDAATLAAGATVKRWVRKQKGQHVNVVAACPARRGDDEVQYDAQTNRCWANVAY